MTFFWCYTEFRQYCVKVATKKVTENVVIVSLHKNNVIDKSEVERNSVVFATTYIPPGLVSFILY